VNVAAAQAKGETAAERPAKTENTEDLNDACILFPLFAPPARIKQRFNYSKRGAREKRQKKETPQSACN
jgi:hypothetical protein